MEETGLILSIAGFLLSIAIFYGTKVWRNELRRDRDITRIQYFDAMQIELNKIIIQKPGMAAIFKKNKGLQEEFNIKNAQLQEFAFMYLNIFQMVHDYKEVPEFKIAFESWEQYMTIVIRDSKILNKIIEDNEEMKTYDHSFVLYMRALQSKSMND